MMRLKRLNNVINNLNSENGRVLPVILLILLVVVAGGGYVYFFTDLLSGSEKEISYNVYQSTLVKKPLPPRKETSEAMDTEKDANGQKALPTVPSAKTGSQSPSQIKTAKPDKLPVLKTNKQAVENAGPKAKPGKAAVEKQGVKPQPSLKSETTQEKGKYTLLIGVYVLKKSMTAEQSRIKSAGFIPVISKGPKKVEPMNRLFIGRFDSYAEASLEVKKVAKATKDAFILNEKGKFVVYAGSYYEMTRAASERDRLAKAGFNPEIVRTKAAVNTFKLTAGSFATKELAAKEALRLKKLGLKASVVGSGV